MEYEGTMNQMEAETIAENYNYDTDGSSDAKAVQSGKWWMVVIGGRQSLGNHAPDKVGGESSDERGQARAESEGGESAEL